jgi:hypothetical protein
MQRRKSRAPMLMDDEFDGKLPVWPEDFREFITQHLTRPCSISGFVERLGLPSRRPNGKGVSRAWEKVAEAFERGLAQGWLVKIDDTQKAWRLKEQLQQRAS